MFLILLLFAFANSQNCYVCNNGLNTLPCGDATSKFEFNLFYLPFSCCSGIPLCFQSQQNARIILSSNSYYQPYSGEGFCNVTFPTNQFDTLTIQSSTLAQYAHIYCDSQVYFNNYSYSRHHSSLLHLIIIPQLLFQEFISLEVILQMQEDAYMPLPIGKNSGTSLHLQKNLIDFPAF